MSKTLATNKIVVAVMGFAIIASFALAFAAPMSANALTCSTFTRNQSMGQSGGEIMAIQQFLNSAGFVVSASGAGSPGNESSYFGAKTKAAVIKFQNAYASDILTPAGLSAGTGFWGAGSRAKANALCAGSPTPSPTPGPTAGGNVMIAAGAQPANSLAPQGAARVPFTNFTLTNSSNAAVTITGIVVQRVGLAQDGVFSGIVLVDSSNVQIGTSKTLNSNHQTTVGDTFTIQPGQSMSLTVAGNMNSSLSAYSGQVVGLAVVGVNTTSTVSGSLPINGAQHTVNSTLSIGAISTSTSAFNPGSTQTKSIGDTGIKFSGIRFTANSSEDVKLYSLRWRQVGTVSASDLANVVTVINGTTYPTTLSADGKYYTSVVPGGILIAKGNSIDAYVQGDLVGSNSTSRTVEFDIDKVTDVYFVGQTYGYGIAPSGTYTPWFVGFSVSVTGGSATTIAKATEVPAQNIAVNVSNQPLGGFVADIKGEPISIQSMVFSVATTSGGTAWTGTLTSVSIVNENGVVVAGPVDAASSGATLTFTDTVTFPLGRHIYSLKGKVPTGATNGATYIISSTPSSQWTNVTGQSTGNTVSLSGNGAFSMNTMTVRAGSLKVALATTPVAQNITAGAQGVTFANYQFDATQSGEDVRFSSMVLDYNLGADTFASNIARLSSCQVYDANGVALNTGSNVVNPSTTSTTTTPTTATFTLDNSVSVPKGTVWTATLKCNVVSSAPSGSVFQWGITSTHIAAIAATGVTSGNSITPASTSGSDYNGQKQTISSGSLAVTTDSSSPSYAIAAGGAQNVTLGVAKFRASNEAMTLTRVGLILSNTASSSAADLTAVTLWAGGLQIGSASFVGSSYNATSTLSSPLSLPKDTDVLVTIKGNLGTIGTSAATTSSGDLIAVNIESNTNTQATGNQSGTTVNSTGSTSVAGVRLMKAYPTVARIAPSSSQLTAQTGQELARFTVMANSGDVALNEFTVNVATSSVSTTNGTTSVTNLRVVGYSDSSCSSPVAGSAFTGTLDGQGQVTTDAGGAGLLSGGNNKLVNLGILTVPSGATYCFKIKGDVAQVAGTTGSAGQVTTKLVGDSTYPSLSTLMGTYATSLGNFIWSPVSTTTAATANNDWTNGYFVQANSAFNDSTTLTK